MGCPGSTLKNETYADFAVSVVSLFYIWSTIKLGLKHNRVIGGGGTNGRFTQQMDK